MKKSFFNFFIVIVYLFLIAESFLIPLPRLINTRILFVLLVILLLFLRLKKVKIFSLKITSYLISVSFILVAFALLLMILESLCGFQYVELNLHLSYSRFFYLSLLSSALAAYSQSFILNKKKIKIILFIVPVYLSLFAFFIYLRNNQFFRVLIKDDHLIEYAQFFLLIISSILSIFLRKFWWKKQIFLGLIFLFIAFALFFMAGEEISWGQRIFNIETPEQLAERNLQNELTVHNIDSLFGLVYRIYMIIGFIGSTAWIFFKFIKKYLSKNLKIIASNLIPDWYLSPYFAVAFFYNLERIYLNPRTGEALWEEPMELLLILGITVFLFIKFLRVFLKKYSKVINDR